MSMLKVRSQEILPGDVLLEVDEEEFLAVLDARVRAEIATSVPQETSEAAP